MRGTRNCFAMSEINIGRCVTMWSIVDSLVMFYSGNTLAANTTHVMSCYHRYWPRISQFQLLLATKSHWCNKILIFHNVGFLIDVHPLVNQTIDTIYSI